MLHTLTRGLSALALIVATPALAQTASSSADTLSMHLRTIAAQPRNMAALLGAGQAALEVGDPNAAIGFFARAEEIDGRNARAKAGLASALVMMERPDDALKLFGEAVSLGVNESEIAKDRGLAYDLRGDTGRAQRDYALASRRGGDDELTRRYALSLGISGERERALQMLTPLLYKKDQGAWRARAFVAAMNGDVKGAEAIARAVMPASLAGTMSPFLTRLATLNAADRAHAVNFGTMPSNGQNYAMVQTGDPFRPIGGGSGQAGDTLIPVGDPLGPRPGDIAPTRRIEPVSREPRRRPDRQAGEALAAAPGFRAAPFSARVGERIAAVDPARLPPEARGQGGTITTIGGTVLPAPVARQTTTSPAVSYPPPARVDATISTGTAPPKPFVADPGPSVIVAAPAPSALVSAPLDKPVFETAPVATPLVTAAVGPSAAVATPPLVSATPVAKPPVATSAVSAPVPATVAPVPVDIMPKAIVPAVATPAPGTRLASLLAGIEVEPESEPLALPSAAELRAQRLAAARKAEAAAKLAAADKAAKDAKAAEVALAKKSPPRIWVQVATGANEAGLPATWKRIRDANASALKGQAAYSVPFRATNRLLVGPVKSSADARALVNTLAKGGLQATLFGSEAGQEVVKLAAK